MSIETSGSKIIADALKQLGVEVIFGIVGIPVVEVAESCIANNIKFIGFRNEQAASYAASAYGYMTGKPGVCLVVSGPGVVHALPGVLNAQVNHWPLVLLGGSSDTHQLGMGSFQELDQVDAVKSYVKFAARPPTIGHIPITLERAFRTAVYGRPGPTYVDLPGDFIQSNYATANIPHIDMVPSPPITLANPSAIDDAVRILRGAKYPLIIIGKGAAYSHSELSIRSLVDQTGIPFLPTPMGKGVVPDSHHLCVSAARSQALHTADVVLLLGARLNWILHFGRPPKFSPDVFFIHVDITPEEPLTNSPASKTLPLIGHLPAVVGQLLVHPNLPRLDRSAPHVAKLLETARSNHIKTAQSGLTTAEAPLTYQAAFAVIKKVLPKEGVVYVSEGANTMDIARSWFDVDEPRSRLDAGTNATMGVGMGFCIAAQVANPDKVIVSITGDSAFGFSAMELETSVRAALPLLIFVINNNGVYHGLSPAEFQSAQKTQTLPSTSLLPNTRYDLLAEACGGKGWNVTNQRELEKAAREAWAEVNKKEVGKCCVVNVVIIPGGRKKLEFAWMTKTEAKI